MKITVFGLGYVGLANALLLARDHEVSAVDLDRERVEQIARGESPFADQQIESALADGHWPVTVATAPHGVLIGSDYAVIATPTNYDEETNCFDTSSVEQVLAQVDRISPQTAVIIKSTVPVGFTERMRHRYPNLEIHFSPEFLREGHALADNLRPARVIVSAETPAGPRFGRLLVAAAEVDCPLVECAATEAEAVKLFSNTYLAMRVAFFNELDTFAMKQGLDAAGIIRGVSLDPRIGDYYNNPSFGYGGYCLPKDTRQLLANYSDVPQSLMAAIVESNRLRKRFIADAVLAENLQCVGVFKLAMKAGSDNARSSSVLDVIARIRQGGVRVIVFDPGYQGAVAGCEMVDDLREFKSQADIILCNRTSPQLSDVRAKVWTRDVWHRD